jgi:hypothetical protein
MGLPSSGQISMNDIRIEMGIPSQSPFGLNEARNGTYVALNTNSPTSPPSTGQVSLSSWYGYCQTCFSHSFSYNSLLANKCVNNDPITIISDTDPIVVGSLLFLSDYSAAFYPYYYTDGTDWYYADSVSEQTEVLSKGVCAPIYSATVYMNSFVDYPYGYADAATACSLGGNTGVAETVYYQGTLGDGTVLYFGNNLTDQFSADGSFGYYWISGYSFTYSSVIANYTVCVVPAALAWTYSETGGANGEMRIYVNSVAVETRTNTSSGTWTGLETGDEIYVEIELLGACSGNDDAGNVYSQSNRGTLTYADCFVASTGTYTSPTYTVVAGDAGTTITLDTYASCDSGCL